jgi:hypothetical protein
MSISSQGTDEEEPSKTAARPRPEQSVWKTPPASQMAESGQGSMGRKDAPYEGHVCVNVVDDDEGMGQAALQHTSEHPAWGVADMLRFPAARAELADEYDEVAAADAQAADDEPEAQIWASHPQQNHVEAILETMLHSSEVQPPSPKRLMEMHNTNKRVDTKKAVRSHQLLFVDRSTRRLAASGKGTASAHPNTKAATSIPAEQTADAGPAAESSESQLVVGFDMDLAGAGHTLDDDELTPASFRAVAAREGWHRPCSALGKVLFCTFVAALAEASLQAHPTGAGGPQFNSTGRADQHSARA